MITLLRSMPFNAKEWINIDHNEVRYNKTVVDFILGLHDVWKVPRTLELSSWLSSLELRSRVT